MPPIEDPCYRVTQTIYCYVYADDEHEAESLAKSHKNWDEWDVDFVESVVLVDPETGDRI